MSEWEGAAARDYHERTKHSLERLRAESRVLDWANQPMPFKVYTGLEAAPLPAEPPRAEAPALAALAAGGAGGPEGANPRLETLARIFFLTAGVTKRISWGEETHYFRAAACTGALYHVEAYLVCGAVGARAGGGLAPGVYHLAAHDYAARRLREGDFRGVLARAAGEGAAPPAALVLTSTYWRNAWKYGARAYRHCYWDGGTMLANALAAAAAFGVPARLVAGFADEPVNRLLGIDPDEEAALAILELGEKGPLPPEPPAVAELRLETMPLSPSRVDYPEIGEAHAAGALSGGEEAARWREAAGRLARASGAGGGGRAFPLPEEEGSEESLDGVILRRGSARRFARRPIRLAQLAAALRAAARPLPADFLPWGHPRLNEIFLIVNAVEGIPPGAYRYDRGREALVQLREGNFRREAGELGLGQELAAQAAVNVYFLCRLGPVLEVLGNRGYRAAQLEGGIMGGRLYLAAYALGFSASGLTFFDDDAVAFFGPAAEGRDVMFLALLGHKPARRASA